MTKSIRNRVVNIRTKIGLDILHHVDGPSDVGTRPNLISAASVQPGSTWLKGKPWMLGWLEAAKEKGIIKHVEDIKLSNDGKKIFSEGVVFDTLVEENDVFAVANVSKEDIK